MKRVVFFMLLVFAFGSFYAAGPQQGTPVNGYDANNNGYYYNGASKNNISPNSQVMDIITYGSLSGNMTDNGDGSGSVTLYLNYVPSNCYYFVLMQKFNDGAWEECTSYSLRYNDFSLNKSYVIYMEYFSGAVTGDSISYKVVYYQKANSKKFLGISNTVELVYQ